MLSCLLFAILNALILIKLPCEVCYDQNRHGSNLVFVWSEWSITQTTWLIHRGPTHGVCVTYIRNV